jgi:peroxiredoxin Q/BCP
MTRRLSALFLVGLLAAGCSGPLVSDPDAVPEEVRARQEGRTPVSGPNARLKPRRAPAPVGSPVPAFVLTDQKGNEVSAVELMTSGDAVLVFSPGLADPAHRAIGPWVARHREAMADRGCEIVVISPESAETNAQWATTDELRVAVLTDDGGAVARGFGVAAMRGGTAGVWTFVAGREGRLIASQAGLPDRTELIAALTVRQGSSDDSFMDMIR